MKTPRKNSGFTLIEVVLIIVIMGILATVAMKTMGPAVERTRIDSTIREMDMLAQAITGNSDLISDGHRSDFGYVGDLGGLPPDLDALAANPGDYATWRGPYILSDFLENPGDFKEDAWGRPYKYTGEIEISSMGNGNPITKRLADSLDEILSNTVNGGVYDGLNAVPGINASRVNIVIYYPDGEGDIESASTVPDASGQFSFSGIIPIGNHLLRAIYLPESDTTSEYITVLPGSKVFCELRFSKSYW